MSELSLEQEKVDMQAAVGKAISKWASVEGRLVDTVAVCIGPVLHQGSLEKGYGYQCLAGEEASAIIFAVESFRAKLEICNSIVSRSLKELDGSKGLTNAWVSLSETMREKSQHRNKLAHWCISSWANRKPGNRVFLCESFFKDYLREAQEKQCPGYRKDDIIRFTEQFQEIAKAVGSFNFELMSFEGLRDRFVERTSRLLEHHSRIEPSVEAHLKQVLSAYE